MFDAHSGVCNLTVRDCEIGHKGIAVVGQGALSVEGSTISSDRPIQLRGDYGSMWNGTAAMTDCTWRPLGQYRGRLFAIDFAFTGASGDGDWWDYGYDRHFPDVTIENLTIDDSLNASQPDHDLLANGLWAFYSREANVGKDPVDYWPASIAVNGFKFVNASHLGTPRFHVTTTDLGTIRERGGNYLVTDVTATADDADVTRRLFAGERVEASGPVSVSIAENATAANTVEVVRDGAAVQAQTGVSGAWKRTFSDAGAYEMRIASKSAGLGWEGFRTLAFTMKAVPAPVCASIAKAKVTLAKTSYAYTGKALKPAVKSVVLGKKKLVANRDYTVAYSANKNVGTAQVTVKGVGSYKGTRVAAFKINPKPTAVTKLAGAKRAFTAKWKKQAVQTSGYQLQYSLTSSFKSVKTLTVSKVKTVFKKVAKLKPAKRYYVRVRTYKKVGKVTFHSTWSKAKPVVTKR